MEALQYAASHFIKEMGSEKSRPVRCHPGSGGACVFFSGHPASWPGRTLLTGHIGADLLHLGPEVSPSPAFPDPPPSVEPHCHSKTGGPGLTPSLPWLPPRSLSPLCRGQMGNSGCTVRMCFLFTGLASLGNPGQVRRLGFITPPVKEQTLPGTGPAVTSCLGLFGTVPVLGQKVSRPGQIGVVDHLNLPHSLFSF